MNSPGGQLKQLIRDAPRHTLSLVLAALVVVAAILLAWNIHDDYESTLSAEYALLERQALLAGARVSGVLRGLDVGLFGLVADQLNDPRPPDALVAQRQRTFLRQFPEVETVFVADPAGHVRQALSLSAPGYAEGLRHFNVAQRDYFLFHKLASQVNFDRSYVARPFEGISGRHMVAVSRAMRGPDGEFLGVVTATFKSDVFEPELQEILRTAAVDAAAIHNRFGDILYRLPDPEKHLGRNIVEGKSFQAYLRSESELTRYLGVVATDGIKRILVFARVGQSELDVGVSCQYASAIESWRRTSLWKVFVFAGFFVLLVAFVAQVRRQRVASQALRESQARYGLILKSSPTGIFHYDPNLVITYCNDRFAAILGTTRERLIGLDMHRLRDQRIVPTLDAPLHGERGYYEGEYLTTTSETQIWVTLTTTPYVVSEGQSNGGIGIIEDISQRKMAESLLHEAKERLETAASAGIIGIWDWDMKNGRIIWDKVMCQLHGIGEQDFKGDYESWFSSIHADDKASLEEDIQAALCGEREFAPEFRVVWPDGSIHHLKVVARTTYDRDGKPVRMIGVNYDQTDQKRIHQELDRMASYDRLTALPNRRLLEDRLLQAMALAERRHDKIALLFIDLDHFKPINDDLGHAVGDWLLQRVAERMQDSLRRSDTVARIGGDEFVVLLPEIHAPQEALAMAEKIRARLQEPFVTDGQVLRISASIGVALYPDHADNPHDLLRYCDRAMYEAKKRQLDGVALFQPGENIAPAAS